MPQSRSKKRNNAKIKKEDGLQLNDSPVIGLNYSVPATSSSFAPSPPKDPFWMIDKPVLERAKLLETRVAVEKAVLFQTLVVERTITRDVDLSSLFEATFDDPTGAAFWKLRLGEMIGPGQFVILLAAFLTAEGGTRSTHELALRTTLTRDLSDTGIIPIATEVEHRSIITHVDPENGNQHTSVAARSFSLEGRWFDPVLVVSWMAEREIYHRFLPSSLRNYLKIGDQPKDEDQLEGKSIGRCGRPKDTGFQKLDRPIAERALGFVEGGEAKSLNEALWRLIGIDGKGAAGSAAPKNKVDRVARVAMTIRKRD